MKKIIIRVFIVLAGIAMLAGIGLTIKQLVDLSDTDSSITLMEEDKLKTNNYNQAFTNDADKFGETQVENRDTSEYKAVYKKDNIFFLSKVSSWDEEMLEDLAEELYKNKHGEEIDYVYSVILYHSSSEPISGTYHLKNEKFE